MSGTEILLDEYVDKTEETLTKKILYFTTEHMETGIDDNAFKILRKEWDGWDDVKKDKVDEIIQKCSKSTKMLTEDDVNVILDNCDGLSVDDVVKMVLGGTVPRGTLTGSLAGLTADERGMVDELLTMGKDVEIIPRSNVQGEKTPDFFVDGVKTELKTLNGTSLNTHQYLKYEKDLNSMLNVLSLMPERQDLH